MINFFHQTFLLKMALLTTTTLLGPGDIAPMRHTKKI